MKQVKYFILFVLLSVFNFSFSQFDLDNKLKEYETASLERKIQLFHSFCQRFDAHQKDSVLYYVNDLLNEGIEKKNEDAIALANYGLAPYLQDNSFFEEADEKTEKAIKHFHKVQNDTMLSDAYNSLGNSSFLQGNIDQAEFYYNKSFDFAVASGDVRFKMLPNFNLGRIYMNQGKFAQAEKMIREYIEFMLGAGDMKNLSSAYGLMGQLYLNQEKYTEAIKNFTRSMESGLAAGSMRAVANGYTNLAIAEFFSGEKDKSEQYFQLALAYRKKEANNYYIAEGYYNLGDFYYGTERLDSAIVNYSNSLRYAEDSKNLTGQKDALSQLSLIYDSLNQVQDQIVILKKLIITQELLAKQQSFKEINVLRSSFVQSQKEAVNTSGIREDQLQGKVVEYQTIFNNWMWIIIACVIVLTVFIYFFKRSANLK